jgi:hypothetical protein
MNGIVLASILILISITFSASYGFFEQGWQNLFCKVAVFGLSDIIECDNMKDTLTFKAGQDIDISLDSATDTITIAAIVQKFNENGTNLGTSGATIFRGESNHIWNFARIYNGTNTIITENATGVIISATMDSSGEASTGANVGTGEGTVFRDKTGTTLNFKSLKQSDNIILTNNADDVTIRGINTAQIVSAGGTSLFKSRDNATQNTIKGLTATHGITLTANTNDVQIDTNFKIDNLSTACSGTDKVSAITFNNSTGDWTVTCSADQTGGGNGGSGIPYNKLWGSFVARSTTGALDGFLTGATLDGTETYTYDTTMASSVISSASGTTAGNNAGLSQVATNTNVFRRDQNALLYAEWRMTEITTNRIFIGFQSGTTPLPNANDDMLNAASGYGLCIQSTDTIYQVCRNDGSGATVFASLGVTEDTNRHTVLIKADSANNRWCISLDGAADTCHTTDIPAATTQLYVSVSGETTDTSGTTFIYSKVYVQNDR